MTQIFGKFIEELPKQEEYLVIGFSPASVSLKERWSNNGLSADFIADYFKTFFVNKINQTNQEENIGLENLRDAVKYVANELLENAMKFQDSSVAYTARIGFSIYHDRLIFLVSNGVKESQVEPLRIFINKILTTDPSEMYFQTMKANAKNNDSHSRLGLLSMVCDYSAELGWKLERTKTEPPVTVINTMVCLEIKAVL